MAADCLPAVDLATINLGWAVNEATLRRLLSLSGSATVLEDLKEMLEHYQRSNGVLEALCCLLLISRKESFDPHLKTTYSYTAQQAVKRIREIWGGIKEYYGLPAADDKSQSAELMSKSIQSIHNEINFLASAVIEISTNHLARMANEEGYQTEKIYYMKINADYSRYLAEVCQNEENITIATKYNDDAWNYLVSLNLAPNNPDYLGMALNYSVFCREIQHKHQYAIDILKKSHAAAVEYYEKEENRLESDKSPNIMILMEDNLDLWTNEANGSPEDKD